MPIQPLRTRRDYGSTAASASEEQNMLIATDEFAEALKDGKFEKGKPADPTKNMSDADAKEWEKQREEHKDEFKSASSKTAVSMMERMQLLSAFQVLAMGTPKAFGISRKDAFKAIKDITGVDLPEDAKPEGKSLDEYMGWMESKKTASQKSAVNLPPDVEKYHKEVAKENPSYSEEKAWATAWSIYCKANPGSEHCHKPAGSYLPKEAGTLSLADYEAELRVAAEDIEPPKQAKFEKDKPADPTKNMSPEDAKEWKRQNEEHKDQFKSAAGRVLLSCADYEAELDKDAKFEKGKSMTVEEVSKVVGPEFKEMNEDPPEAVKKLQDEMEKKAASGRVKVKGRDILFDGTKVGQVVGSRSFWKGAVTDDSGFLPWWDGTPHPMKHFDWKKKSGYYSYFKDIVRDLEAGHFDQEIEQVLGKQGKTAASVSDIKKAIKNGLATGDLGKAISMMEDLSESEMYRMVLSVDPEMSKDEWADKLKQGKTAASGLYGFTKEAERVCGAATNRLSKFTTKLAKEIYEKDSETPAFLEEHQKRTGSRAARMLRGCMASIGPGKPEKTAGKRDGGRYGFSSKTAKLALQACSDVDHEAGVIACELNSRMGAKHATITGFLAKHAKKAKCGWSEMIQEAYPAAPAPIIASVQPTVSEILLWDGTKKARTAGSFLAAEEDVEEDDDAHPKC